MSINRLKDQPTLHHVNPIQTTCSPYNMSNYIIAHVLRLLMFCMRT